MRIDRLDLEQFRCYRLLSIDVPDAGLRIYGRNASGKTSLLEAITVLATTRSPRASSDRELVRWESGADYSVRAYTRIEAHRTGAGHDATVSIGIELDDAGERVARKQFRIDGNDARAHDLIGVITSVLFAPEDVMLVGGPPAERRRQIDILTSQIDRQYLFALSQYGKVLSQRNQLLRQFVRDRRSAWDRGAITEIAFWDEQLVAAGAHVTAERRILASEIATRIADRSATLVEGAAIGFTYVPRIDIVGASLTGDRDRDTSVIAARFEQQLHGRHGEEFRRGMTLTGPHRDDFRFTIDGRDLAAFGSRGQQRLAVIAYKVAEIDVVATRTGYRPLLLLDDVLSELDSVHRDLLLAEVAACGCQVFVTSTDAALLDHAALAHLPLARVEAGALVIEDAHDA